MATCRFFLLVVQPFQLYLPSELIPLLVATTHRTDDWVSVSPDGVVSVIETPATEKERLFSTAYDYCVTNWCQDSSNSLFTLRESEVFVYINICDEPYDGGIEEAVNNVIDDPNHYLSNVCTFNDYIDNSKAVLDLTCVVDGLCGDIHDAYSARDDLNEMKSKRDQLITDHQRHPPVVSATNQQNSHHHKLNRSI